MAKAKKAKKAKKAASKQKRRKLKVAKPAPRKKATAAKPAPRKKATRKTARKVSAKPAPKPLAPQSPAPAATPPGDRVGVVTHYFGDLCVAVVKLDPATILRVGDNIHIKGHTSDFSQRVESLQIGHASVNEVGPDDDFGLKVVDHAREHDVVYRVK
jgi:putative protease